MKTLLSIVLIVASFFLGWKLFDKIHYTKSTLNSEISEVKLGELNSGYVRLIPIDSKQPRTNGVLVSIVSENPDKIDYATTVISGKTFIVTKDYIGNYTLTPTY